MQKIKVKFVSRYKNGDLISTEELDLETGIVSIETPVCLSDLQFYQDIEKEYVQYDGEVFPVIIDVKQVGKARLTDKGLAKIREMVEADAELVRSMATKMQDDLIDFLKSNNLHVSSHKFSVR